MSEQFMISPAGFIAHINHGAIPPNLDVYRPLDGEVVAVPTTGVVSLSGYLGRQGTILASITVGAAGTARAVAFLVDRWPSPTKYIGLGLDTTNRPFAKMNVRGTGVSGQSLPSGPAVINGDPLNICIAFNALAAISGEFMATFQVDGATLGVWSIDPIGPWTPFVPTVLLVGVSPGGGLADLNGVVRHVEVSSKVALSSRTVPATEEESISLILQANSSLTSAGRMKYAATSGPTADAALSAQAGAVYAADADIEADSALAGDLTP